MKKIIKSNPTSPRLPPTLKLRRTSRGASKKGKLRKFRGKLRVDKGNKKSYLPQIHRFFSAKNGRLVIKMGILALGLLFLLYNLTSLLQQEKNTLNKQENKEEMRKKQEIEKKISFWEKEIETKPDYRDAFLNLAVLNFQVKRILIGREYWIKAKEIDPNNEMVKKIGKIIK